MTFKHASPARRLYLAGTIILVAGLIAATVIYFLAANQAGEAVAGYSIVGGNTYALSLDDSSRELQQVERLGGRTAVLVLEFHRWFLSLWHGQRLAYTTAALAAAIALMCFHIAGLMGEYVED